MTTANSIDYKLLTILKKTLTSDQLNYLRQVLNMKANCRQLRSSHLITLSLPPVPLNSVGNKSFRHLAPNKWNHLPKILLSPTVTINMFKRKLNSFLLYFILFYNIYTLHLDTLHYFYFLFYYIVHFYSYRLHIIEHLLIYVKFFVVNKFFKHTRTH